MSTVVHPPTALSRSRAPGAAAPSPAADPAVATHVRPARGLAWLAVVNALIGVLGFAVLAVVFEFPDILDQPASTVLPLFAENEGAVTAAYYALSATGILFALLAVGLHRAVDDRRTTFLAGFTVLGVLAGIAQTIGFARWPFLVPVLSDQYAAGADRESVSTTYEAFNAFAGGAIGEHLGWMLQAAWGVGIALALRVTGAVSRRMAGTGLVLAAGFGALTFGSFALPAGDSLEAIQGPLYTVWVLWTAAATVSLVRRTRGTVR